jgi:hypothetical protein
MDHEVYQQLWGGMADFNTHESQTLQYIQMMLFKRITSFALSEVRYETRVECIQAVKPEGRGRRHFPAPTQSTTTRVYTQKNEHLKKSLWVDFLLLFRVVMADCG